MTKFIPAVAIAVLFGAAAVAQDGQGTTFSEIDTNANGALTLDEIKVVSPGVTAKDVSAYDVNADGQLSEDEFAVWVSGQPAPNGDGMTSDESSDPSEPY